MFISLPSLSYRQGLLLLGRVLLPLPTQHPVLDLLVLPNPLLLLPLIVGVDEVQRIADEVLLDVDIKGRISCKAGRVVDL